MECLIGKLPSISIASKSFKNPQNYCVHSNLPKNAKSHFGSLGPLEVNVLRKMASSTMFKTAYFFPKTTMNFRG
jgi:hypothetical protein